jgi:DNA-binding MarR family transcriptional regulator
LTRQTLQPQVLSAWIGLLRSHAELTRKMNAQLIAEHGLTLNDYDVLVTLADAPERALRRVDLADRVVLSASGITRLLEGLERAGYVCRKSCPEDARVSYAVLTEDGFGKLVEASATHHEDIATMFTEHFSEADLETLGELLGRLVTDRRCMPD